MIRVSGTGVGATSLDAFSDSIVFVADEALLANPPRDRIASAIGQQRAIVWVDAASRLTVLPIGGGDVVPHAVDLGAGIVIPAGTRIEIASASNGDLPDGVVRIVTDGAEAGILMLEGSLALDARIGFFFNRTGPPDPTPYSGYRFAIFSDDGTKKRALARLDPSRPGDRARNRIVAAKPVARPTYFRTRWGNIVTLTETIDSGYVYAHDPMLDEYYLTLDGHWRWGVDGSTAPTIDLLAGLSGMEYVQGPASWLVHFVAESPAFAPYYRAEGPSEPSNAFPLVSTIPDTDTQVTTAWFYVVAPVVDGPTGLAAADVASYFSQPARAALFTPLKDDPYLRTLDLAAATLAPDPSASFPLAPYSGALTSSESIGALRRFEDEVLSAARARTIYGSVSCPEVGGCLPGPTGIVGPTGPVASAVTPQGLLSIFAVDKQATPTAWDQLILARANGGRDLLRLTELTGSLRAALLSNELFLVISNPEKLYRCCSTTYCITDQVLAEARAQKVPEAVCRQAGVLRGTVYDALDYFCPALATVLGSNFAQYGKTFIALAELASLTIEGWTFDVSSRHWANPADPAQSTILIIKFSEDDVESLTRDLSRWTLPDAFNDGGGVATQQRLLNFFAAARAQVGVEPDLQYFVDTVLSNRQDGGLDVWNGVIYLNPVVPTNAFPPDLAALAAGLPSTQLRAHHLGVTLTSFDVTGGAISLADSSLFGLILYQDTADLIYQGNPYDFKVLALRVLFNNSKITSFSSQVELLVAQLFQELSSLVGSLHGDNILFDGTLQNGAYRFSTQTENDFHIASKVVESVIVRSAQFVTLTDQSTIERTVARFILNGAMRFRKIDIFDLFGFGPESELTADPARDGQLSFTNLFVSMDFNPNDPSAAREFLFQAGQMNFDLSGSRARAGSLPRRFPLRAAAMLQSESVTDARGRSKTTVPADFGFIPVGSPLVPGTLGPTWFGLQMTLSFGSPGALAPKLGFTGALLASWAPSSDSYNVAIGIRLPGSAGGKKSLTIMGPLTLDIGQLLFLYDGDTEGYLLRLQNIALSFLGLSFPPNGKTSALLFGDPDPQNTASTLGWYLAYRKNPEKKKDDSKTKALRARKRAALPPADLPADEDGCVPCGKK